MKTLKTFWMVIIILTGSTLSGQAEKDSMLIRETALNYIEGLFTNDYKRMEKAIHPELAKRVIKKNEDGYYRLSNMGYSELLFYTNTLETKDKNPDEAFEADVIIFDISQDIATIKVTQNKYNFFDYIHLGKIDGEWKIINLLWARNN